MSFFALIKKGRKKSRLIFSFWKYYKAFTSAAPRPLRSLDAFRYPE
jgi:hypothetical protein